MPRCAGTRWNGFARRLRGPNLPGSGGGNRGGRSRQSTPSSVWPGLPGSSRRRSSSFPRQVRPFWGTCAITAETTPTTAPCASGFMAGSRIPRTGSPPIRSGALSFCLAIAAPAGKRPLPAGSGFWTILPIMCVLARRGCSASTAARKPILQPAISLSLSAPRKSSGPASPVHFGRARGMRPSVSRTRSHG